MYGLNVKTYQRHLRASKKLLRILLFTLNSYLLHLPFGNNIGEFFVASVIHI